MKMESIKAREKKDLEYLVEQLMQCLKTRPHAILLCGGYGRGEGAWIENELGEPMPYNDYDLAVISDEFLSTEEYTELRKKLAADIGIEWIDIDFYRPAELNKLKCTIKNVDLAYASRLLYGDEKIYDLIPKHNAEKIGKQDILKLYQTRIWTFLGSWDGAFRDLETDEARFFKNQMAKGILAACDMYLISKKVYTPSYAKRVEYICTYFSEKCELCEQARWALKEKLRPSSEPLSCAMMIEMYNKAKQIFCDAVCESMGRQGKAFVEPTRTRKYFLFHTDFLLRDTYNRLVRKSPIITKVLDVFLAQNFVLYAKTANAINEKYMEEANRLLMKWNYIEKPIESWDVIHTVVADARNNI